MPSFRARMINAMLRLTARLSEVATARVVRAEKVDGTMADLFGLQDRLARILVEALHLRAPTPPAVRPQLSAFECYARGRRLIDRLERGNNARLQLGQALLHAVERAGDHRLRVVGACQCGGLRAGRCRQ